MPPDPNNPDIVETDDAEVVDTTSAGVAGLSLALQYMKDARLIAPTETTQTILATLVKAHLVPVTVTIDVLPLELARRGYLPHEALGLYQSLLTE